MEAPTPETVFENPTPRTAHHVVERGSYTVIEGTSPEKPTDFSRSLAPLDEVEVREIASRCLLCGACGECSACLDIFGCPAMYVEDGKAAIDEVLCTGCGVCAIFCPNGAIVEAPIA